MVENGSPDKEHGRGLQIVAALSKWWNCRWSPSGKVVWCELENPPRPVTAVGLSIRTPRRPDIGEHTPEIQLDRRTVARVHRALKRLLEIPGGTPGA